MKPDSDKSVLVNSINKGLQKKIVEEELKNQVPTGFLLFTCLLIPVAVFSGVLVAEFDYLNGLDSHERQAEHQYSIDGYSIMFVSPSENSEMSGATGFTYRGRSDDIFIRKSLLENENWELISKTCRHELLHNLGLESHEKIYLYETQISDPVCEKLMDRVTSSPT